MARNVRIAAACLVAAGTLAVSAPPAGATYPDVPPGYWAAAAIRYVAQERDWMGGDDALAFRPEAPLLRRELARALALAFAPGQPADPSVAISDLPLEDPSFAFASVAVKRRWMSAPGGAFSPDAQVVKLELDQALVRALRLHREIRGLSRIRTADGRRLVVPPGFAPLVLAHQLGLHPNHGDDGRELWPEMPVRRADAAHALHRAATLPGSRRASLARYRSIVLPAMSEEARVAAEFALAQAGAPYVWAGEWPEPTPPGYCCGPQAVGGFDCSGYAWWVLRAADTLWSNRAHRPYTGWSLPERSSREMARATPVPLRLGQTRLMDLMFFDADRSGGGWRGVDHVGLSLGGGWMVHSSSGRGGVSIDWVRDGWWRSRFVWSRRVLP